jgi:ricin-type beta-trefoil lectin protein
VKRRVITFFTALAVVLGVGAVVATPAFAVVEGPYRIKVPGYNLCLDVRDVSQANGAYLQVYTCLQYQYNQQFYLRTGVGSRVEIRAAHSGKCLDVKDVSLNAGAHIQQWDCLGASQKNQQFFRNTFYGNKQFMAEHSQKCISVVSSPYIGADVVQDRCTGGGGYDMWLVQPW